ncbi:hypothetical protein ADUPG1_009185, partial [Aduncisulcus paluster]
LKMSESTSDVVKTEDSSSITQKGTNPAAPNANNLKFNTSVSSASSPGQRDGKKHPRMLSRSMKVVASTDNGDITSKKSSKKTTSSSITDSRKRKHPSVNKSPIPSDSSASSTPTWFDEEESPVDTHKLKEQQGKGEDISSQNSIFRKKDSSKRTIHSSRADIRFDLDKTVLEASGEDCQRKSMPSRRSKSSRGLPIRSKSSCQVPQSQPLIPHAPCVMQIKSVKSRFKSVKHRLGSAGSSRRGSVDSLGLLSSKGKKKKSTSPPESFMDFDGIGIPLSIPMGSSGIK